CCSFHFPLFPAAPYSLLFFFVTPPPPTEIYTLSLHDALPIFASRSASSTSSASIRSTPTQRPASRASYAAISPSTATIRTRPRRSEEHTSELQSRSDLVCRLLLEKKKKKTKN